MKNKPKRSVLNKDILRELIKTKTKFISITFMIMLGVFVSIGMKITTPIMKETIINYVQKSKLYDIRVSSSQQLEEKDIEDIKKIDNISNIEKGYEVKLPIKNKGIDIQLSSFSTKINQPEIVEGRLPELDKEILLDSWLKKYYKLGDTLELAGETKKNFRENIDLKNTSFKVVGFANSVEHIDLFEDKKTLTDDVTGIATSFGYISKENFDSDKFSYIFVNTNYIDTNKFGDEQHIKDSAKLKSDIMRVLRKRPSEVYSKARDKLVKEQRKLDDTKYKLEFALKNPSSFTEEEISRYKKDLSDVNAGIDKITKLLDIVVQPTYTIKSQYDITSINEFYNSADKLDAISNIFSGFFFMIAILVSLTTMTRMVEEQRIQIGTLKALGYKNFQITKKYFIYGFLASTIGIIGGIIIGHSVILKMIYQAYSDSSQLPPYVITFQPTIIIVVCIISYACTTLSVKLAVDNMLKERVSVLLRGKPPKKGTRIFLERAKWLWKKMNFFQKVSARNIFRYKARMWMTIIGIAGCTGLLYLGFALRSSITGIEAKQFGELFKYDLTISYNPYSDRADIDRFNKIIKDNEIIKQSIDAYGENTYAEGATNKKAPNVNLIVVDEDENTDDFIYFRNMNNEHVGITESGALLNVKLGQILKSEKGSRISMNISSQETSLKVSDIIESYIGHNVYMSKEYYEIVTNKRVKNNLKLIKLKAHSVDELKKLIKELSDNEIVVSVENMTIGKNVLHTLGDSMNIVVLVMVICSTLLAMVVLYNLTNINISERIRELATIKVLGFFSKEVTTYVYRETLLLTILGQALGLLLGNIMHSYVAWELPPESVMLDASAIPLNYFIAIGITFVITLVISFIIHFKLKNVNMVEAMKEVE